MYAGCAFVRVCAYVWLFSYVVENVRGEVDGWRICHV